MSGPQICAMSKASIPTSIRTSQPDASPIVIATGYCQYMSGVNPDDNDSQMPGTSKNPPTSNGDRSIE